MEVEVGLLWVLLSGALFWLAREGSLGPANERLLAQALLARERGLQADLTGEPPLPLLLLLPNPSPAWLLGLGALALGGVGLLALQEARERRSLLPLFTLIPLYLSPLGPRLVQESLGDSLGLLAGYAAWGLYRRYLQEGLAFWLFSAGLVAALAAAASLFGFLLVLLFALGIGFFKPLPRESWLSAALVFFFPSLILVAGWSAVGWLLSREPASLVGAYPFGLRSAWSLEWESLGPALPFGLVFLYLLIQPSPQGLVYAMPLLLKTAGLPMAFSREGFYALLNLFVAGGLPGKAATWIRWAILGALLLQGGFFWQLQPPPARLEEADWARRVLSTSAKASVLASWERAHRYLALAGTGPFLLPGDSEWELAVDAPYLHVTRVLVCPQDSLERRFGRDPPKGFFVEMRFKDGCLLYLRF